MSNDGQWCTNRPLTILKKEPGASDILYIFIQEVQLSGARASINIVNIQTFYKMYMQISFNSDSG